MKESLLNMYKNLIQLRKLKGCKIVSESRRGFSAEITLREGKYLIRLDYSVGRRPRVYMLEPEIDMSSSLEIHTFGKTYHGAYKRRLPELCLTYSKYKEWNETVLLTDSYIPWAIEWTEFYELWLLTGKWYGGGIHLGEEEKTDGKDTEKNCEDT